MTKIDVKAPPAGGLSGACQPIPHVRAEIRDARGQGHWVVETHIVANLDLDGQGSPVVLVPPDNQNLNQYNMWWRLFIRRGDCGHELGIIMGIEDPVPEPGESYGMRNFGVVESVPTEFWDDLQGIGVTTYVFDGERYVGGRTEYR